MRTTQIDDCNFVSGSCTSVTKGNIFKIKLFGQMESHLNLMVQLIDIIVCIGLTKTQTSLKKRPPWVRHCHGLDLPANVGNHDFTS